MTGADRRSRFGRARHRLVALVGVTLLLTVPAARAQGQGSSVSRAEAASLAREAVTDDGALAELRAVDRVDGQPVDLTSATTELGVARRTRLTALADQLSAGAPPGSPGAPAAGTKEARSRARQVLDQDKYQPTDVPKPFKGVLEWLADRLRPVGRFFGRLFEPILALPGGAFFLGALLIGAGTAAAAWLASRRSRAAVRTGAGGWSLVDPAADPAALDALAERCEADGDRDGAVRHRHQAGLLRLERSGRLVLRADTTAADAAHQVAEPVLDALTADFEQIVYGARSATSDDVERMRAGWIELLGVRSGR